MEQGIGKNTKTSQRPASQRPIKVLSYLQGELGYRDIIIMYILWSNYIACILDDNQSISVNFWYKQSK